MSASETLADSPMRFVAERGQQLQRWYTNQSGDAKASQSLPICEVMDGWRFLGCAVQMNGLDAMQAETFSGEIMGKFTL